MALRKIQVTLKSGAQVEAVVGAAQVTQDPTTKVVTDVVWTTPPNSPGAKLQAIVPSEIVAIVIVREYPDA